MSDRRGRSKGIAVEVVDEPTSRGRSAETAYRRLVRSSSNTFRSSIEFREKPRQIIFGGLLLVAIATMAYFNSSNSAEPMMSSKGAVTAFMLSVITYCSLQSKDGLMVWISSPCNVKFGSLSYVLIPCYGVQSMAWRCFISVR